MRDQIVQSEKDLSAILKRRRKELGITQKDLAKYANLSHNGISRIEMADKSARLSSLLKMSKILGFQVFLKMEDL